MATPYIGSHAFITLGGTISPAGEEVETWHIPGVDGLGVRTVGKRAPEHTLLPIKDYATSSARNDAIQELMDLCGTIQWVIDDTGNMAKCVIIDVRQARPPRNVKSATGGVNNGDYLLFMRFRVRLKN